MTLSTSASQKTLRYVIRKIILSIDKIYEIIIIFDYIRYFSAMSFYIITGETVDLLEFKTLELMST